MLFDLTQGKTKIALLITNHTIFIFIISVINYCANVHDILISNTLNITNLLAGAYTITLEVRSSDIYNSYDADSISLYCDIPYLKVPSEPLNIIITTVSFTIKKFMDEVLIFKLSYH
jgi:hypothetical protein